MKKKYLIIGEDERQIQLAKLYKTKAISEDDKAIANKTKKSDIIIIPISAPSEKLENLLINTKKNALIFGGNASNNLKQKSNFFNITTVPSFQEENAVPTAEGAVLLALQHKQLLHNSCCLVLGYGNCGSKIVSLLLSFGIVIDIYDNKFTNTFSILEERVRAIDFEAVTENLTNYDFIFNTIPAQIFSSKHLKKISGTIINIASHDAGFPIDRRFPNIPSKYFPKAAAEIMKKAIDEVIKGGS